MGSDFYPNHLGGEQRRVVQAIISGGNRYLRRLRPSERYQKIIAGLETGIVEQGLLNRPGGGGTSSGWRQETVSSYPNVNRLDLRASVARFFHEIAGVHGGSAGRMAQAVQRSAYPGRYDQHSREAQAIYKAFGGKAGFASGGGGGGGGKSAGSGGVAAPSQAGLSATQALLAASLQKPSLPPATNPTPPLVNAQSELKLPQGYQQVQPSQPAAVNDPTKALQAALALTAPTGGIPSSGGTGAAKGAARAPTARSSGKLPSGVGTFDGKRVAAWIIPELQYARAHGWRGTVNSGYRSFADQTRIWNSGVRPAARPGHSNHEGSQFPRGAVDVSQAAQLSRILSRKHSLLVWAGGKDPVHFSHPHGGSY